MRVVRGDILNAEMDVTIQQVNARGVMGSGLALQIRNKFPVVFKEYKTMCDIFNNDWELLQGKFVTTLVIDENRPRFFCSIFGQDGYGYNGVHTDYYSLFKGIRSVKSFALSNKKSIAIPSGIGCGLGGGDWERVFSFIFKEFYDFPYEVEVWKL